MSVVTISPLLLMGANPSRPAEPISDGAAAAEAIRSGRRVIVPTPAVLAETLVQLGAHEDEARAQVLAYLAPGDGLEGLPAP